MTAVLRSSRRSLRVAAAQTPDRLWLRWLLVALTAAAPLSLFAQTAAHQGDGFLFQRPSFTFAIRGGYDRPLASSDIYKFTTTQLTLDKGDFAAAGYAVDAGFRLRDRLDLTFSAGEARRTAGSEFRKYIDNNDQPIEQTTSLRRIPLSMGVKYALRDPGERIGKLAWIPSQFTPWVGIGGGAMQYTFRQKGDFVDFETLNVFNRTFTSKGWTPMAYAHLGADISLNQRFALTGDLRYSYARAPLTGAFVGFDRIDLSGTAATMGFSVRY